MNNYTYAICSVATDLSNVDFGEVITTSADTSRRSLDGTLFLLKWKSTPEFITDGTITPSQTLNQTECLTLMKTAAWEAETLI